MQKKNIAFILCILVLSNLVACGNTEETIHQNESSEQIVEESTVEPSTEEITTTIASTEEVSSVPETTEVSTESTEEATTESEYINEYYTEKEDGTIEFTQEGLGFLYEYDYFEGASPEEINAFFNDDSDNGGKRFLEHVKRDKSSISMMDCLFNDSKTDNIKIRLHKETSSTTASNNNQTSTDKSTTTSSTNQNQQQQQTQQSQGQQQATSQEQQQPATQTPSQSEVQQSEAPVSIDEANITMDEIGFHSDRNVYADTTGNGGDASVTEHVDIEGLEIYL